MAIGPEANRRTFLILCRHQRRTQGLASLGERRIDEASQQLLDASEQREQNRELNAGRTVFVLGAEREGMQHELIQRCDLRLTIPGTGQEESLNIASAVAVLLGAFASSGAHSSTAR